MLGSRCAVIALFTAGLASGACTPASTFDAGTPDQRAQLFDEILAKTMARDAFSPIKNSRLQLNAEAAMRRYRDELVAADTEEKLYYALAKISNARKDRHLSVGLVDGGLRLPDTVGVGAAQSNYPVPGTSIPHAPIRFAVDYGTPGAYSIFVADFAEHLTELAGNIQLPAVGDRVLAINGRTLAEYVDAVEPHHRYSSTNGFWWQLATWLPQRSRQFPPEVYEEALSLELERTNGETYAVRLPYLAPGSFDWEGHSDRRYPGFRAVYDADTYSLYRPEDDRHVLLLVWNGFRDNLEADMDRLMDYAESNDLLNHAVIVDATRSRGGSSGAYAVRRLSPKPFRTTFGNLRISDAAIAFARDRMGRLQDRTRFPGVPGDGDDGTWLLEWFEEDFMPAVERGDEYSNNVPFKSAHLSKDSDGFVQPADVHFSGPLIVWLSPYGGSHLDQFASIVVDNELGHTMGMPAAGYSNTWEWEEVLLMPGSEQPIVSFMWNIGHTIRPNGEILEGNAAEVEDYVPITRENLENYYQELLRRSFEYLK